MRKNNNEFQKKKNVVLFLFGYACIICGLVDVNNHVHHVDRDNSNNDAFNLVPLCGHCHKLAHRLSINLQFHYSTALRDKLQLLNSYF